MQDAAKYRTDVAIIGAGPTGLTAGVRLAQLGVDHLVIDRSCEPTSTSKAALVHAATLELFEQLGLVEKAIASGVVMRRLVMVDRGHPLLSIEFARLKTAYPFALGLPQSTTERLLLRRLRDLGGSVWRPVEIDSLVPDGDRYLLGATEVADDGSPGASVEVEARYVIGADGAHSLVREAMGIAFEGSSYAEQFILADVGLNLTGTRTGDEDDQATIHLSPAGVTVLGRLPGGTHRVVATVPEGLEVPEEPSRAFVDELFASRRVPASTAADPLWASRFRVHHRIAETFRTGGIFLAGDAAHVHSPAAGQGMNTGIADAFDVATRVAAVLAGQAGDHVLEEYDASRRAAALEVLRFTDRMTRMALMRHRLPRTGRWIAAHTVGRSALVQRRIATWVTGLQRSPLRTGVTDLPGLLPAGPPAETSTADV
jgi:2-polyprenyl-6-methoxyphenol hydroxylase-like FAD-dependent oxidoreductase